VPLAKNILARFKSVTSNGARGSFSALCPAHADSSPSLSIATGSDGRVLLHCHAGCKLEDILKNSGLTVNDLFPTKHAPVIKKFAPIISPARVRRDAMRENFVTALAEKLGATQHIAYRYSENQVVVRFELLRSGKTFRPIHFDGAVWSQGDGPHPWPLYRQNSLENPGLVFVVEGEKCADTLTALGFAATTSPHGAGSARKANWAALEGREIAILPDNDAPGEKYAREVASLLTGSTKIVKLPGLEIGEDIADWIRAGGSKKRLLRLVSRAPEIKSGDSFLSQKSSENLGNASLFRPLKIGDFYKNTPDKIEWLIENLIPKGTLCALAGIMKTGKTELATQMVAALARGGEILNYPTRKTKTLILALEGHPAELRRRLAAHGVQPENEVFIHNGRLPNTAEQVNEIAEFIGANGIELAVLDSWAAFSGVDDENSNAHVLQALQPLRVLIERTGATVLLVAHSKKSGGAHGTQIRGAGSLFGELDQALILERRHGGAATNRTLNIIGRYAESPPEMILDYAEGRYALIGAVSAPNALTEKVIAILDDGKPRDVHAIADQAQTSAKVIRKICETLLTEKRIARTSAGSRGKPFLFVGGKK